MPSTEYYNSIAAGYNELHAAEQLEKLQTACVRLTTHVVLTKHAKILDVGCGTGVSSDFWAQRFHCDVVGVDPAKALIAQNTNDWCEFVVAAAESLPLPDEAFDLVVSFTAIQNFDDVKKGLSEMLRVCRAGGWLLVTTLSKGPDIEKIRAQISQSLTVMEEFPARNDTVWICKKPLPVKDKTK